MVKEDIPDTKDGSDTEDKPDMKFNADTKAPATESSAVQTQAEECELVFCGSTKWDLLGRKTIPKSVLERGGSDAGEELLGPTRLSFAGLAGRRFVSVFTGCAAAHLILVDGKGVGYGMGRNDSGQLGKGDLKCRRHPVKLTLGVEKGERVVHAACGRQHTVVVTDKGRAFAVGGNASGQLGNGGKTELKKPEVAEWTGMQMPAEEKVVCCGAGSDFSVLCCESGTVYCAGSGQYGQLGNGRTGECIEGNNRIAFDVMAVPVRVGGFGSGEGEVKVVQVACGTNHTLALDAEGKVWSWGFGGYGRLGHKTPQDELRPRKIEAFAGPAYKLDMVTCGQQSSFAAQGNRKSCYMWGLAKRTGESNMYPKPQFDLQGWVVRSFASGATSTVVAAEKSVISWGGSPTFGELGYGEGKPKSSTKPKIMEAVEGLVTRQVAEGMAFTVLLVRVESEEDRKIFDKLRILKIEGEAEEDMEGGEEKAGEKRKQSANGTRGGGKKKTKKKRK